MEDNLFTPELLQAAGYTQPYKTYAVGDFALACLSMISAELGRVMWNSTQKEFPSPFGNTSNRYSNDVFEVEAYSWDDETQQPYNFKWKNVEISWYKYVGRGMSSNIDITPDIAAKMLRECLESLRRIDDEAMIAKSMLVTE